MPITRLNPKEAQEVIEEWTAALDALFQQVQRWIAEDLSRDWQISFSPSDIAEESLGRYVTWVMEINAPEGRLVLEPVGRDVLGAKGRVDLYAWPSLYRVMLLRSFTDEDWVIRTESGINWPQPWDKESFLAVAGQLLGAA